LSSSHYDDIGALTYYNQFAALWHAQFCYCDADAIYPQGVVFPFRGLLPRGPPHPRVCVITKLFGQPVLRLYKIGQLLYKLVMGITIYSFTWIATVYRKH